MPVPSFFRSPRPDDTPEGSPASQFPSRFSALHNNVRSIINGSSIYSESPAPSSNNTPKVPFLGFLRRPQSSHPSAISDDNFALRDSNDSRSPLRPEHTAGSYIREIAPLEDPRESRVVYSRHPADVSLDYGDDRDGLDPETQQLQEEVHGRSRRRRHRRRKHRRQQTHWVRRQSSRDGCFLAFVEGTAARGKAFACLISGLFLITTLSIYLALALTDKALRQEVHVLFIMVILATTIFFCHSLIRLCMLILHPPAETPRIPSMTGPEGFRPLNPIRVHLARDDDLGAEEEVIETVEKKLAPPPPAYGLWRSSVRVDPDLMHWQRVEEARGRPASTHPASRNGSVTEVADPLPTTERDGPRPPSYASDDGVSYVVEAGPRSVAPSHSGVSDIHPAWRPGYAISEVRLDEWPASQRA
ncbi:hypothetical protein BDV95DRAFT_500277 [Massariosphaeria phaeospora]|uniref:Uncharacterized protein n=1 Tax=Massariosphaeria phaeospora TaxID=100035 RepID=A0A7C8IAQ1_9PLEO|nr:hypothetical protein BDV95DRAFT_500277 [Massariosphaeria phaeospora]